MIKQRGKLKCKTHVIIEGRSYSEKITVLRWKILRLRTEKSFICRQNSSNTLEEDLVHFPLSGEERKELNFVIIRTSYFLNVIQFL